MKFSSKLPDVAKKIDLEKSKSRSTLIVAGLAVVIIFCLVGSKQLLSLAVYQRKVINARNAAVKQVNKNLANVASLDQSYKLFDETDPNIIGGKNTTDTEAQPPDGNNARIVLNALPSKYDFPALISSVYKIMANNHVSSPAVTATDQSLTIDDKPTANPQPLQIPMVISGTANYKSVLTVMKDLERSIRPFDMTIVELTGSNGTMTFSITGSTYYQPARIVDTTTKEIK